MSSAAITTVMKMMESLPLDVQDRVAEHLREYIDDLQDEILERILSTNTTVSLLQDAKNKKLLKGSDYTGLRPAMKSAVLPSFGLSIDG